MSHLTRVLVHGPAPSLHATSLQELMDHLDEWSEFDKRVELWMESQRKLGHMIVRYGWSDTYGDIDRYELGFVDKGIAMLFKLTFGGE